MSLVKFTLNLITLGGYGELSQASSEYQAAYRQYRHDHAQLTSTIAETNAEVARLGKAIIPAFKALKRSKALLRPVLLREVESAQVDRLIWNTLAIKGENPIIGEIVESYSAAVPAVGGAGAGAALAAGSWALVGIAGTASTGTAISALSGVAASNATLAWFGGGALAAGGAGMAGGGWVLAAITMLPTVLVCAWYAYRKADKLQRETELVFLENDRIVGEYAQARTRMQLVEEGIRELMPAAEMLSRSFSDVAKSLLPVPFFSWWRRRVGTWFGKPFYADDELAALSDLEDCISGFVNNFSRASRRISTTMPPLS